MRGKNNCPSLALAATQKILLHAVLLSSGWQCTMLDGGKELEMFYAIGMNVTSFLIIAQTKQLITLINITNN